MEFNLEFQLKLLTILYNDKQFYFNVKALIKPEFFRSLFFQWLFNLLDTYTEKYHELPTRLVILQELKKDTSFVSLPEEQKWIDQFINSFDNTNKAELEYVKDNFIQFAKSSSIRNYLNGQDETIDHGNFNDLLYGLKEENKKFDFQEPEPDDNTFSLLHLKELYEIKQGIRSGIGLIDNHVGGLYPKEESLILADTNVGKSLCLTYIGSNAVRQLKKVVHVTLEMSKARTLARYLAALADEDDDIYYNNIKDCEPQDKVIEYVHDALRERYSGCLEIKEFPTGKCTIQDLYNLIDKYPDTELLIVDYLQLLKPPKKRNELRFDLSDIAIALRGLASETKIHVATAQQASKLAANRRVVGKEFTAEDYGIMRVVDVAIGLGQNKMDAQNNEVVMFLAKSRNSEKYLAERYVIDFRTMRFRKQRMENLMDGGGIH